MMSGFAVSDFIDGSVDLTDPALYGSGGQAAVLPALAYRSAVFAAMEDERIWTPCWVCIGTEAEIPETGDLLAYTVGAQGVHVQRDVDGTMIARYNKAQHGGCRFVPSQCRTGTKTSCSFTSCGYSRDRKPIKAASLVGTSKEAYQYLGMRPDRLPAVPLVQLGALLFVNLDPASAAGGAPEAPPLIPRNWLPAPGSPLRGAVWHEVNANWKALAPSLVQGAGVEEARNGEFLSGTTMRGDGEPIEAFWKFPNLVLWRTLRSLAVIVLQPTALAKTLCRVSLFAADASVATAALEMSATLGHLQSRASLATISGSTEVDFHCNRQVARHVLIGRPGYRPGAAYPEGAVAPQ